MYLSHFTLREEPFGVTPDRRFFYQTAQHREAVATLFYAIQQRRGFALLFGRAGLGKTTVLFALVQMLKGKAQIAYLANPFYDRATVLESILASLGLEPAASAAANHKLFYHYLLKTQSAGKTVVVVFDEAQDLNRDTLEAIRMLSNFETPSGKLLQIVLAGQPRLAETLQRPDCEQIRQRFNAIARLEPLTRGEIHEYMVHRLQTAGGAIGLFTPGAIDNIASASAGVPRNINTICFNALTLAYALDKHQVGAPEVSEVLRDLALPQGTALQPVQCGAVPLDCAEPPGSALLAATPPAPRPSGSALVVVSEPRPSGSALVVVSEPRPSGSGLVVAPAFTQIPQPFRPAWIVGGAAALFAYMFLLTRFLK